MTQITLSEILKLIQIIDNKEFKISGERLLILSFETIRNNLAKILNETFDNYKIDEKNIHDFDFILTKSTKEEKND